MKNTPNIENVKRIIADEYPLTAGFRCVEIIIPDDDSYLQVLAGFVALLGRNYAWQGTAEDRESRSQLWREAYALTDLEQCMSCEDVADCIEENEAVQDALEDNLINNINNSSDVYNALQQILQQQIAAENPVADSADNLAYGVEDCDFDKIKGMADSAVAWLNQNNIDFFERLVVATTPAARAAAMSAEIPGFSGGVLGQGLSTAITFLSGSLKANYEAFYDTAYEDALECEIFCLASINCSLTVDNLYALFSARIGFVELVPTFYNGFIFAVTGTWSGTQFADVMMFIQIAAFKFMGGFHGYMGINPLANTIAEGYNEPVEDWDDCDCPEAWCIKIDATNGLDTLFFPTGGLGAQAVWSGTGWARNDAVAPSRITIAMSMASAHNLISIRVVNTLEIDNGDTNTKSLLDYPSFAVYESQPALADVTFELGVLAVQQFAIDCVSDANALGAPVPGEIIEVYLTGIGTPPEIGAFRLNDFSPILDTPNT